MNFANITLGELLSSNDPIIKRNALSILRTLQRERDKEQQRILTQTKQTKPQHPGFTR